MAALAEKKSFQEKLQGQKWLVERVFAYAAHQTSVSG